MYNRICGDPAYSKPLALPWLQLWTLESTCGWGLGMKWWLETWSLTLSTCSQLQHLILNLQQSPHLALSSCYVVLALVMSPNLREIWWFFKLSRNMHLTFVALAVANFCMFDLYDNWITCPLPFLAYYLSTRCLSQCVRTQQALNKHLLNERMCILLWIFHCVNDEINVLCIATYCLQTQSPRQTRLHPIPYTLSSAHSTDFYKNIYHSPYNTIVVFNPYTPSLSLRL